MPSLTDLIALVALLPALGAAAILARGHARIKRERITYLRARERHAHRCATTRARAKASADEAIWHDTVSRLN